MSRSTSCCAREGGAATVDARICASAPADTPLRPAVRPTSAHSQHDGRWNLECIPISYAFSYFQAPCTRPRHPGFFVPEHANGALLRHSLWIRDFPCVVFT